MISEANLKQAFDMFDLDKNGQITPRELKHVIQGKSAGMSDPEWDNLIAEYDKNNDGQINFEEFKAMML